MHEVIDGAADRSYGIHVAKLAGLPISVIKRAEEVLKFLENDGKSNNISQLVDDLPLFAAAHHVDKEDSNEAEKYKPLLELLDSIIPDDLTPKQALEKLYEIKSIKIS